MEYRKSYKGLVLWLLGFTAVMCAPMLLETEDGGLLTRLSLNLTSLGIVALMAIIWRTESAYWINGVTFEQARDAGSARRRAFAMAHLRAFGRFAAGFALFSVIMQARGVHFAADIVVFCVGIVATAIGTIRIRL